MIDYLKKYLSLEEFRVIELDFSTLDKVAFPNSASNAFFSTGATAILTNVETILNGNCEILSFLF